MSYTEIYGFNKKGKVYSQGEVVNAWRGASAIWNILSEKYLGRKFSMFSETGCKETWDLFNNPKLTKYERIVLGSTFDKCLVKKENFQELINAFNEFQGETSLKEQANILSEMLKDKNCIAVGWNQTSVNGDTWVSYNYNSKKEEYESYNCLKQEEHWWLFDEIEAEKALKENENNE